MASSFADGSAGVSAVGASAVGASAAAGSAVSGASSSARACIGRMAKARIVTAIPKTIRVVDISSPSVRFGTSRAPSVPFAEDGSAGRGRNANRNLKMRRLDPPPSVQIGAGASWILDAGTRHAVPLLHAAAEAPFTPGLIRPRPLR
jgi:hypothetical protein